MPVERMEPVKKVLLLSTDVLWDQNHGHPHPGIILALQGVVDDGHILVVLSRRPKPPWFEEHFSFIRHFIQCNGRERRNGQVVRDFLEADKEAFHHSDFIVVAGNESDFFMATNSKTCLVRAMWSLNLGDKLSRYGVGLRKPRSIRRVLELLEDSIPWYFHHKSPNQQVYALTNAGTITETNRDVVRLADRLRACLKNGTPTSSMGFRLALLSSLSRTPIFREVDMWSYYPSSTSTNNGGEVMAEFTNLARVSFKCRTYGPLIIRHAPSVKRHLVGGDRTDPSSQIKTIHLNPKYEGRLEGKRVVVLDDYITYGVSFGVTVALLKAAGASEVINVAMGKFGRQARLYDIRIDNDTDVFQPITDYDFRGSQMMGGRVEESATLNFLKKFKNEL